MAAEFAVFLLRTKNFNVLPTYCSRAYSICDKLSQNDGWRTHCARAEAILSTTVVISIHFVWRRRSWPPDGRGSNTRSYNQSINFII